MKERNKTRKDNLEIDLASFISVKGISALGNQLTKDKVLEINPLDPLPYDVEEEVAALDSDDFDEHEGASDSNDPLTPEEQTKKIMDIDVQEEPVQQPNTNNNTNDDESSSGSDNGQGQITLF